MAAVSCSFVIVGRLYDDPVVGRPSVEVRASVAAVEGGTVAGGRWGLRRRTHGGRRIEGLWYQIGRIADPSRDLP
jgi:hypothetical protein